MLIAGDIGGTKTDLAIYSKESGPHLPVAAVEFHSADYPTLQAMVSKFAAPDTSRWRLKTSPRVLTTPGLAVRIARLQKEMIARGLSEGAAPRC